MKAAQDPDHAPREGAQGGEAITGLEVLVTAQEAYPALERAFLAAREEVSASFRIFDLSTRLRSKEARALGETWFDLFIHTLERGVAIRLVVSDFDPVAAPDLHRKAWRTQRQIATVRELCRADVRLSFVAALHSGRTGAVPRVLFYPLVRKKLNALAQSWRAMTLAQRTQFRAETPRLRDICREDEKGELRFRARLVDLHPATHHQKLAVFDRSTVYIGGLDLNERRFDTKGHDRAARHTWHDIQLIATGPVAAAAQAHLDGFLSSVANAASPARPAASGFLRTLSRVCPGTVLRVAPRPILREIEAQHLRGVQGAERLIYLETQFLRHMPLARALARRARRCPGLRLIVVLPAAPEDVAFASSRGLDARFGEHLQLRCLERLKAAFGPDRVLIASPVQPHIRESGARDTLKRAPLIYVHSKVSIFDNSGAIVSSANLNGRSLRWDSEAGLHLTRADQVSELRRRVMGHWLPEDAGAEYLDQETAFDNWRQLVEFNSASPPHVRRGFLVGYESAVAREVAAPVPGMPEEMV